MARDPKAEAALALHRFGFGPRIGSVAAIASDPRGAVLAELEPSGAGRIADPDLLTGAEAARAAFHFRQEKRAQRLAQRAERQIDKQAAAQPGAGAPAAGPDRAGRMADRACRKCDAGETQARSRARHSTAALSRRGEGADRCRAGRRTRVRRASRLVLVEPFLRLG